MNTKNLALIISIATTIASTGFAQTNTFPSSGNVGIGTSQPSAKLHLIVPSGGPSTASLIIDGSTSQQSGSPQLRIGVDETNEYSWIQSHGSRPLRINELGNNTLLNSYGGRVSIGTTSANAPLFISGSNSQEGPSIPKVLAVADPSDISKTVSLGYDQNHDAGVLVSVDGGTSWKNTLIQPYGGYVGIGTTNPSHKLSVDGTVRAKEVIVDTGWSDFVFEEDYNLRSLGDVETHIEEHGHLPDVPSAAIVESEGLSVGEAQKIMMQKIEELTLYMIEQEKKNQAQQMRIEELERKLREQGE